MIPTQILFIIFHIFTLIPPFSDYIERVSARTDDFLPIHKDMIPFFTIMPIKNPCDIKISHGFLFLKVREAS